MITRKIAVALMALFVVAVPAATIYAAGPPAGTPGADHAATIAYWTGERIANATPREMIRDGAPVIPSKKPSGTPGGGGNGGGGGGGEESPAVGGDSWTSDGLVQATVGKVLFSMGGNDYVCSGTVVQDSRANQSLVLTAGHCVFDEADGFATNWMFMPAFEDHPSLYNGSFDCDILTFGCWTSSVLVTSTGWSSEDFDEDYGFAVMGAGGNSNTLLEAEVGFQKIGFSETRPATVYSFGYPHANPYDGSDLVYCAGATVADGWGGSDAAGLKCDMTGGSSGGGWFGSFSEGSGEGTLVSVNSFKYRGGKWAKYMFGPRFDSDTAVTYGAANSAAFPGPNVIQ